MKILAKAPGKLILLGEYAVLEGAPALVAAVNRLARVTIKASKNNSFEVEAPVIDVDLQQFILDAKGKVRFLKKSIKKLKFFLSIFECAISELNRKNILTAPIRITLDTSEFFLRKGAVKLGLGSSAALTVALLAALFAYYDDNGLMNQKQMELFQTALPAHRTGQNNVGSGTDVAACVFGGFLQYKLTPQNHQNPAEILPVEPLSDLLYLPIWTGKASSTSDLINRFYAFKQKNGNGFRKLSGELSELSDAGCSAFKDKNSSDFLTAIRCYYKKMIEVGDYIKTPVVSLEHKKIADLVYDFGAVYKPSGAGGGDLGIAIVRSADELTNLASIIQKAGFEIVHLQMGAKGVDVVEAS